MPVEPSREISTRKVMLGCCLPRDPSKHTNKLINAALERDRKEMNTESKLLLLGEIASAGRSFDSLFPGQVQENRAKALLSNR